MNPSWPAWECRDQADRAELYYNQPLRTKNRKLEAENMALKRLLRDNGITWQPNRPSLAKASRVTRSGKSQNTSLPRLPVEILLRILSYAMTSPHPIVDPLCKSQPERMTAREKAKHNIAINFLATCRAYHYEGTQFLWTNNTFVFTSPVTLAHFSELDFRYRQQIKHVTFRLIAKFYDDEDRVHRLPRSYHPDLRTSIKLVVQRRPKEKTLARGGFRAYAWYQLIDFLEAMLPPYEPRAAAASNNSWPAQPRPRLLPSLETLRIDFVNFTDDLLQYPPPQLHDLASHQLGCMLNEIILTGVPTDECGLRVSTELSGLLKDEGLMIDHAPIMLAVKNGIRQLKCGDHVCHYSSKVVRAMRYVNDPHIFGTGHHDHDTMEFPPAPADEGEPPYSLYHSCRTIWKKIPVTLDGEERAWELFDRISGMPWEVIEDEATVFDFIEEEEDHPSVCENCGNAHPGALLSEELMELYDDDF
ncbi:hypothetical protein GGR50DRAFT_34960 [Xylaria sp. CBS 124048]|nr:hypothetical protein GGR50DRAFT_34960 [Xylaria sp. CBS 124048]